MKKLTPIFVIVLAVTVVVAISVSNPPIKNEESIYCDLSKIEIGDREEACPPEHTCYYSAIQPKGGDIVDVVGDSLCHKNCELDSDCPSNMPVCDYVTIWSGDFGELKKVCLN